MSSEEIVICRTCSIECKDFKSLYKQGIVLGEVTTLAALLNFCTDLEMNSEEDFLPHQICISCINHLVKSYAFKKMVLEVDEQLRKQHYEATTLSMQNDAFTVVEVLEASVDDVYKYENDEEEADELRELAVAAQIKQALESRLVQKSEHEEHDEMTVENERILVTGPDDFTPISDRSPSNVMTEVEQEVLITDQCMDGEIEEVIDSTFRKRHNRIGKLTRTRGPTQHSKPTNPKWKCRECGKQLSNQHSFKYHMQLHSNVTPFVCSLCGEGFKTKNAYDGHVSMHDPNNPNVCHICGKTYRQSSSLRTHMLNHTGEKPFQCEICGKGMTQKSGYKKHMLIHSNEKPHTCDICGRDFRYSSNLLAHKRSHTGGDKPYSCKFCIKCFPTAEQLKRHAVVHSNDRPFSCAHCDKSFKRRSYLIHHQHVHENNSSDSVVDEINEKTLKSKGIEVI